MDESLLEIRDYEGNVLELVKDRFDIGTFAQQDFIHQRHKHVFQIGANGCHWFCR